MSAAVAVVRCAEALQAGDFVMLHPQAQRITPLRPHPDAGRVGRIERLDEFNLWVCFRDHVEQSGRAHCILPRAAWVTVDRERVETRTDASGAITWVTNRERAING